MGLSTLHLLNYNNYYNRLLKREETISDYATYRIGSPISGVSFNPNDGVSTSQVINNWESVYSQEPDYLLAEDPNTGKFTRWFILEAARNLANQYTLTLRRDVIAESYADIFFNSVAYVEKGWVPSSSNLIFNNEGLQLNQILFRKLLVKDKTGVSWITLYTAADRFGKTDDQNPDTINVTWAKPTKEYQSFLDWNALRDNWEYYDYTYIDSTHEIQPAQSFKVSSIYYSAQGQSPIVPSGAQKQQYRYLTVKNKAYVPSVVSTDDQGTSYGNPNYAYSYTSDTYIDFETEFSNNLKSKEESITDELRATFETEFRTAKSYISPDKLTAILAQNGKLLKIGDAYYNIKVDVTRPLESSETQTWLGVPTVVSNARASGILNTTLSASAKIHYVGDKREVLITLEEQRDGSLTLTTTATNTPKNTPYKIIQIPYCNENGKRAAYKINGSTYHNNPEVCYGIAQKLIEKLGSTGALYDAQLLPYCLQQTNIDEDGNLSFDTTQTGTSQVAFIKDADNYHRGIAIYCDTASTEFDVPFDWPIEDYKIESQTDLLRFCSPTYANCYEMNPAKNGGISNLHISMTAKPSVPYIRVAPNFGRLYGSDFDKDSRGLVCGGDFSLPQTTDAWMSYQAQNATFQQSFDRQIQNMEVNNSIAKEQEIWQAVAGSFSGTAGGFAAGAQVGKGPVGAIVGGVGAAIGAGASIAGGVRSVQLGDIARKEALDYTRDQFNYSLQNIKARPDTLTRVGADTVDNPYFPFIEYYSCSSEEDDILRDKIKYNGMTIMQITSELNKFVNPLDLTYIKAKMIRMPIVEDTHYFNEVANEMNMGVYLE